MNDLSDLTERAYGARRSLVTIAALVAVLNNFDRYGTKRLTTDFPSYSNHDDEQKPSTNNER